MASISQIRNRLLEGFSEKQADLLAHVVIEAHDDLVNQADFHALTGVVKELAESQKELADSQKKLADADDLARAVRRTAALASAGFTSLGIVACESISPQTLAAARDHGLRVLTNGWLLPEAA